MPANLGLVTHAAERHARELAIGGSRDGLPERGLADAGRTDQTQDRTLELLHPLLHGEILDDALLDLLESVVVGLEDFFRFDEVVADFGAFLPWNADEPVDVIAHHGRLC